MTETCTVASSTPHDDIFPGSSGILLPGYEARIVDEDGNDITAYDQAGELWMRSPSVTTLGYLDNAKATQETFLEGGWLRSGDKALFRKSPKGTEHVWIVDRVKELIKVKVGPQLGALELNTKANVPIGPPSRAGGARGAPPHAPGRRRHGGHSRAGRPVGRGAQGVRGQGVVGRHRG